MQRPPHPLHGPDWLLADGRDPGWQSRRVNRGVVCFVHPDSPGRRQSFVTEYLFSAHHSPKWGAQCDGRWRISCFSPYFSYLVSVKISHLHGAEHIPVRYLSGTALSIPLIPVLQVISNICKEANRDNQRCSEKTSSRQAGVSRKSRPAWPIRAHHARNP